MQEPRDSFYVAVGRAVRRARERAGLSQDRVARAIGLSRTSVTNIECGRQPIQVHVLVRFAQVLGEPVSALLPTPKTAKPDPHLEARLKLLEPDNRAWVRRVLAPTVRGADDESH